MHHENRTWRQLMVILRGLPGDSHYVVAQRNDPAVAEYVAKQPDSDRKWAPPSSEWGLAQELLASVVDRLGELVAATINQNAKQPIQPPPRYPRPVTEIDRALVRLEAAVEDELANLITLGHQTWAAEHPTQ